MRYWNIILGTFFFRYRNLLFPGVILFAAIVTRPRIMLGSPSLDRILIVSGTAVALGGEVVRLFTIGLDYIHRGGKDSQVYARRLVQGGVYAITRNPMYVGNVLIAIGMTMATSSPLAYVLIIPLFLFVYHTIVLAEEKYLRNKFGSEYDNYCDKVNRFVPPMSGILSLFSGLRYDWKRALRKDLGTITGL
ncbi:MAG: methyltransferase family protein, partial [Bacteroidota bacterium]